MHHDLTVDSVLRLKGLHLHSTTRTITVTSLLDKLRPPNKSDLTRKRKILRNRSHQGKCLKHPKCSSNPKSVTPLQRVREFGDKKLIVSAGKLFCETCREELSLRNSTIKNHIRSSKHNSMKDRLKERRVTDEHIVQSLKKI